MLIVLSEMYVMFTCVRALRNVYVCTCLHQNKSPAEGSVSRLLFNCE